MACVLENLMYEKEETMTMNEQGAAMVNLVRAMVLALVDDPDAVTVTGDQANGCLLVNVGVSPDDVGKVIGRQGRTARSIRTVMGAAAVKAHVRFELNIGGFGEREEAAHA
jgi:predicted RNA-binding protein YlqC (UPF0109 family)